MTARGGERGDKSAETRRAEREEGLAFARRWREARGPVAASAPYPFRDHRTCAEWEPV
jgi:hypothetical protein